MAEPRKRATATTDAEKTEAVKGAEPNTNTEGENGAGNIEAVKEKPQTEPNGDTKNVETSEQLVAKDAEILELQQKLAESKADNEAKDKVIAGQREEISKLSDEALNGGSLKAEVATAQVAETDVKLVKVQFLKDHSFTMGTTDIKALKGQTKQVDVFSANKLSARGIAVLVSK